MPIAWNDSLALGEPVIDADHRRMMGLIARLEQAAAGGLCLEEAGRVLDELSDLCRAHFEREEALQARIDFPGRDEHRLAHRMLLNRLDAVTRHYAEGDAEVRGGIVRTLGDSLATWLRGHITGNDMEFRPYMAGGS